MDGNQANKVEEQNQLRREAALLWQAHGRVPRRPGAENAAISPALTQPAERGTPDPLDDPASFAGF